MALVTEENISIDPTAVTPAAYGDGVTGLVYGDASPLYHIKEYLVALGGVVTISSTRTSGVGDTANGVSNSDQWVNAYHTAYGLAYFGITMPAVHGRVRSLVFQRGGVSVGYTLRVKEVWDAGDYNIAAGGTATQVPTLAGESVVVGSGTDAAPTCDAYFASGAGAYVMQCTGYDDAPLCGAMLMYPSAGTTPGGPGFLFALDAYEDGTFDTDQDSAPLVSCPSGTGLPSATMLGFDEVASGSICRILAQRGLGGEAWKGMRMRLPSDMGAGNTNPYTSKRPAMEAWYYRATSPVDPGGRSRLFKLYLPTSSIPQTGNLVSTKDTLIVGPLAVPWSGTEPL